MEAYNYLKDKLKLELEGPMLEIKEITKFAFIPDDRESISGRTEADSCINGFDSRRKYNHWDVDFTEEKQIKEEETKNEGE